MRSLALFLVAICVGLVQPHGWLKEPVARTSIQLRPEFNTQQPYWWDHQGVWCGNVQQADATAPSCGRCGDAAGETTANQGGMYDKGVIVATYSAGQIIDVVTEFGAPHSGQFHFELCPQVQETDNCFQRLTIVGGSETVENNKMCVNREGEHQITTRVQLPAGVRCTRCTLRWTYRTHYPGQPYDPDWYPCKLNTYPAQTFRNCADIRIN